MNIDHLNIVCTDSGTIIPASAAIIVDFRDLDDEQQEIFNNGSDNEIVDLALELGKPIKY